MQCIMYVCQQGGTMSKPMSEMSQIELELELTNLELVFELETNELEKQLLLIMIEQCERLINIRSIDD